MIIEQQPNKQNLVTYFMLPMLGLTKSSFGADNLLNSYLDKEGYVVVNTKEEVKLDNIITHSAYITDYVTTDSTINYVLAIPDEYHHDIELFIAGSYSQLSAKLKVEIAKGHSSDSVITKMLNPSKQDREKIAEELHVKVDLIKEIKSPPSDSNFIKIK